MMMREESLSDLATRHCRATKPQYNMHGFASTVYGITDRELRLVSKGKRNPSLKFLRRLDQAHTRLFPTESVAVSVGGVRIILNPQPSAN